MSDRAADAPNDDGPSASDTTDWLAVRVVDDELRRWIEQGGIGEREVIISVDVEPPTLVVDSDRPGPARIRGIRPGSASSTQLDEAAAYLEQVTGVAPVTLRAAAALSTRLSAKAAGEVVTQPWVTAVHPNRRLT